MHKPTAARAIHTGVNSAKRNMLPNQLSTPQSSQAARMPSQHPFFTAAQHVSLVLSAWVYSVYSSVTTSGAVCRYSCWKVVITMFCRLSSCCLSPHNHVNNCKPTNDMRNPPPPLMITAVEKRRHIDIWGISPKSIFSHQLLAAHPLLELRRSAAWGSRNNHSIKSNRLHQPPPHQRTIASHSLIHSPYFHRFSTTTFSTHSFHHTTAAAVSSAVTARSNIVAAAAAVVATSSKSSLRPPLLLVPPACSSLCTLFLGAAVALPWCCSEPSPSPSKSPP
jgi:hypothetical protein